MSHDALAEVLPRVSSRVPRVPLGDWPTPVEPLDPALGAARSGDLWVKREDRSARPYGGNKVRPLETVFAHMRSRGVERVWSTGAWGSNQALATALHAPRAGLCGAAVLFPQPESRCAAHNLAALLSVADHLILLPSIAAFPAAAGLGGVLERFPRPRDAVMAPGAAVPLGALGHVAAALEVALEVRAGRIPAPRHVILPVGSTCTTAGLLAGFAVAAHLGMGLAAGSPRVHAVRVTPWPVTARQRIVGLARRTLALLHARGGPSPSDLVDPGDRLVVSGRYLGPGYGRVTTGGLEARARFAIADAPALDTTYSAKAGAYLLDHAGGLDGPILFWSTKSSQPLPPADSGAIGRARRDVRRWLARGHASE
ncbi:MAG: pyridoxal-phosphate dependent enzyme [Myxococcota bacterium]